MLAAPSTLPSPNRFSSAVAELDRLSQGSGLTFDERRHLTGDLPNGIDPAFVTRRLDALRRAQRWQPLTLAGVVGVATVGVLMASEGWPSPVTLVMILTAFSTVVLKHIQISHKVRVYESLASTVPSSAVASRIRSQSAAHRSSDG